MELMSKSRSGCGRSRGSGLAHKAIEVAACTKRTARCFKVKVACSKVTVVRAAPTACVAHHGTESSDVCVGRTVARFVRALTLVVQVCALVYSIHVVVKCCNL